VRSKITAMKKTTNKIGKLNEEVKTPFRGHVGGITFRGTLSLLRRADVAPSTPFGFADLSFLYS